MSRVLVTGASGFIGSRALVALLERGFEVHAVARRRRPALDGVTWHQADLLDDSSARRLVARARPSHLLHLAWCSEPGAFWSSPENLAWVGATLRLLGAFAGAGGRRAVLAGTCAEYDWTCAGGPLSEDASPLAPATLYGVCKDATRRVAGALGDTADVEIAWGRVFFLYGPGEHPARLVSSVARALTRGERAATSDGRQVRDFMHVEDVAAAFAALTACDVHGAVNVASGEEVAIRDVVTAIARAAGRPDLLDVGALAGRPGEPPRLVADVQRLRAEVGFAPAWTLRAGLEATVEWWRAQPPPS